ncbi:AAA family ATPase [Pseudomonas fluorescens]|uniref:Chromosome partition protein Smc n=1 Tax=Pseudomonas fluorescens TaxID=294 RepID=A0A5E7ASB1_PSEFL|nr:AAA family ATPase [Pseudomonas fluorescens]VVN79437.1 Chromosome partition protein Smc [Pseudomonas fluorescens]
MIPEVFFADKGPTLFVTRFLVIKSGEFVYDQTFKFGVNIIRGDNGTGKSTIMDLLYYGLGAEITDWTEEQIACDDTIVEVKLNYKAFCLKREISETGKAAMYLYEGNADAALADNLNWFRYPNARNRDTHSYSQQLFLLMGLPSHKTDESKNLTMHQILRLMYVDQLTQTTKLLKEDKNYDNADIRKAVGEYLLGIDDLEAHNLRQELIDANREFDALTSELKAIYRFLGADAALIRRERIESDLAVLNAEIIVLEEKRKSIRHEKLEHVTEGVRERATAIAEELETLSADKADMEERKSIITSEIVDTKLFLQSLKQRLAALENSKTTSSSLGELIFKYCPACLSPIESHPDGSACGLCKAGFDLEKRHYSYIQKINEIHFQIRESEYLLKKYQAKSDSISSSLPMISHRLNSLKMEYAELMSNADAVDAAISEIGAQIGFARSQITSYGEKLKMVDQIEDLTTRKTGANTRITTLKEKLEALAEATKNRYQDVYSDIEEIAKEFIKADGGYENVFEDPEDVTFDFARDKMAVNGRSKFSASSMVILKNSIRVAIFIHSVKDQMARYPRFLMLDNIEDKGMMEARSQNFQRVLVEKCDELENDYQVICTTSMIDPKLNTSNYVVGPFYKKGEHTLKFSKGKAH